MLKKVLLCGLGGAVALTVGILVGHFGIKKGGTSPECVQDVDESVIAQFLAEVDNNRIQENLR